MEPPKNLGAFSMIPFRAGRRALTGANWQNPSASRRRGGTRTLNTHHYQITTAELHYVKLLAPLDDWMTSQPISRDTVLTVNVNRHVV
jgi:hypothetical protein